MNAKILFIYITCESVAQAQEIATTCVKEKLAACGNIYPEIISIYEWNQELHTNKETTLILKTNQHNYPALEQRVKELHSYECPCITAFPSETGFQGYFDWIEDRTSF